MTMVMPAVCPVPGVWWKIHEPMTACPVDLVSVAAGQRALCDVWSMFDRL